MPDDICIQEIENKFKAALNTYNKLEALFKISQFVKKLFQIPVLNEYRYISRALVDYHQAENIDEKSKAVSKLEVAIAAAYNDILDSIVMSINSIISELKNNYPHVDSHEILNKYDYKNILNAIIKSEKIISDSRSDRSKRFKNYEEFSNSKEYTTLVEFSRFLTLIEYEFQEAANISDYGLKLNILNKIHESFKNFHMGEKDALPRFELYYQPKYGTNKKIIGAEALVRLRLSNNLVLSPIHFMDDINQADLLEELDVLVLKIAAETINEIKKILPENFQISINVSPSTIDGYTYIEVFNQIIREYKIENFLSLEIIESWNHSKDENIKAHYKLGNLDKKTNIAIDDFGSGQTKLDYLVMIANIDTIKIDKIYIDKLEAKNSENALKLIKGIFELAKKIELKVIAEGIETETQFEQLKDIGINAFQGYYFSKPIELDAFVKRIKGSYA